MLHTRSLLVAAGVAGALAARPRLLRWGATGADQSRPLPGDGLIPGEGPTTTMATTIHAPAEAIWAWLVQMGWDRGGWYSWDHLDHGGQPSATTINRAWQHLEPGQHLASMPDERAWFEVAHVEPARSLVLRAAMDLRGRPLDPAGPRPRWYSDSRWEFFLDPQPDGTTRLLVRSGGAGAPRALLALGNWTFWHPAHVVMQLRQLHELRRRAEGAAPEVAARAVRDEPPAPRDPVPARS